MTIRNPRTYVLLLILLCSAGALYGQDAPEGLSKGLREYQAGQFDAALGAFQSAAEESAGTDYEAYADFWVARSLMALSRYGDASDAFDVFLAAYAQHPYREEARYQRARLFYLTEEYEAALRGFGDFLEDYPESDFSANALYWTGESLFELGRLSESRRFFEEVTERYPTSYRVEAARYRQDIIDLEQREDELLTLMQWSHEEYLLALDEFRQKELAYQEALQSYRDRLSTLAQEDFQEEIEALSGRVSELEDTLALKEDQINELLAELRQAEARADALVEISAAAARQPAAEPASTSGEPAQGSTSPAAAASTVQSELLSLKAAALELQQRLLQQGSDE